MLFIEEVIEIKDEDTGLSIKVKWSDGIIKKYFKADLGKISHWVDLLTCELVSDKLNLMLKNLYNKHYCFLESKYTIDKGHILSADEENIKEII